MTCGDECGRSSLPITDLDAVCSMNLSSTLYGRFVLVDGVKEGYSGKIHWLDRRYEFLSLQNLVLDIYERTSSIAGSIDGNKCTE